MLASPETIRHLVECRFLYEPSAELDAFVALLPAAHWARYDLSAVRLGWAVARMLQSSSTETKEEWDSGNVRSNSKA